MPRMTPFQKNVLTVAIPVLALIIMAQVAPGLLGEIIAAPLREIQPMVGDLLTLVIIILGAGFFFKKMFGKKGGDKKS